MRLHTSLLSGGMAKTLVAHTGKLLTIAGSARWSHGHQRLDWLYAHDFAIEIAPDLDNLHGLATRIWPYVQKGLPVRFRTSAGYEFADAEPEAAQQAMARHMAMVDAVSEYDQPDVHWAQRAGAGITLDLGHALSSGAARRMAIGEYIDRVADRLVGVRFYEKKTHRQQAPADMRILGPVVDQLSQTDCRWWTIALEKPAEMKATRRMALNHLDWIGEFQYQRVASGRQH